MKLTHNQATHKIRIPTTKRLGLFTEHLRAMLSFIFNFFLFLAVLGLHCCARAFSSCGERGLHFVAVRRLLIVVASLVVEHGLQVRRLSSCGARAQLLCGMWDPPGPGIEPVSPALAGGFLTIVPPGKPSHSFLFP